jgi:hypothetical protein
MKQRADKIIDRHDAPDIFCDGVLAIGLRQDVARLTLHTDRIDAADSKTVNRVVIGHLSMTPAGFVDLYNQMTAVVQHLTKTGKVHRVESPSLQQVESPSQQP